MIYYLSFFFPFTENLLQGTTLGHQYVVKEYNQYWCRGYMFFHGSLYHVCFRAQDACLLIFRFN